MKAKRFKLGIKNVKQVLPVVKKTEAAIKKEKILSFESIKGFRKAITPKRVELLHITKEKHPKSIQELARLLKRDIKSVATDVRILEGLGLIDIRRKTDGRKEAMPVVEYSRITLEIVV